MINLTDYGIKMWDDEKIASFRRTLLNWYDNENATCLGAELRILTLYGFLKLCCNRHKWLR